MTKETSQNRKERHAENPKPLTRRNRQNESYTRTEKVETEIRSALSLDWSALIARASISDKSSPSFLQEESLVYFIRDALGRKEEKAFRNLIQILHSRCVNYIYSCFSSFDPDKRDDAFQNVITHVIDKIMDLEDDSGDFFQVRFWFGLKRLILTEYENQVKATEGDKENLIFMDEQVEGEEGLQPMMEFPGNCLSPEDTVILKAGLSSIKDPYRKAFILRYYVGWPIKSNDPDEVTLSSYFGVTPRTIQNWLDAAEESLAKWRKEKKR